MIRQEQNFAPDRGKWICGRCKVPLEQIKVQALYLQSAFDVKLPRCPKCGMTLIPESLAEGKMQEVEALVEDK